MDDVPICKGCNELFTPSSVRQLYCDKKCRGRHSNKVYRERRANGVPKAEKSEAWKAAVMSSEDQAVEVEWRRYAKDNERKRNKPIPFTLTAPEFGELIFKPCHYRGAEPTQKMHVGQRKRSSIDRLDSKVGYAPGNCVPACWRCNKMKGTLGAKTFLEHCRAITLRAQAEAVDAGKGLAMADRVRFYAAAFPQWPDSAPKVGLDGRIYGMWLLGQDYRNKTRYHGAYPPRFLDRVMAMFPDKKSILHLFSGSLPQGPYTRFDRRQDDEVECDVQGEAEKLSDYFKAGAFDLIIADPPYTEEDAARYGTCLIKRNVVVKECAKVMQTGAHLVWLDMVFPMYRKDTFSLAGSIGVVRSTNHRFRVVSMFEKLEQEAPAAPALDAGITEF